MERRFRTVLLIERVRNNPTASKELGLTDRSYIKDASFNTCEICNDIDPAVMIDSE